MPELYNVIGDFEVKRREGKIIKKERTGVNLKPGIARQEMMQVAQVLKLPQQRVQATVYVGFDDINDSEVELIA